MPANPGEHQPLVPADEALARVLVATADGAADTLQVVAVGPWARGHRTSLVGPPERGVGWARGPTSRPDGRWHECDGHLRVVPSSGRLSCLDAPGSAAAGVLRASSVRG